MADKARLQVKGSADPERWDDVGVAGVPVPIAGADSPSIDSFGRLRTSQTGQRFDVEFIYDKQPLLIDGVVGGSGSATHSANSRDVALATGGDTTNDYAYLYSHYDIPYTAGNSQLIDITGTLDNADIGSGTAQIFFRSKVTGTVVETVYAQSAWTENTVSDADWAKSQILQIDFQSLKVGRIRFNLVRNGIPVPIHEIYNDNIRASGYWQSPTLPVMWRIYNDATYTYMEMGYGDGDNAVGLRYRIAKNAGATMRAICATAKSEGGQNVLDMNGYPFSIDNVLTGVTASTTLVPILSIRVAANLNSITNRLLAIPENFELSTDNPIRFAILYRPSLTGASWTAVNGTYSGMEYDVSASAVSGGILINSGYVATSRNVLIGNEGLLGRTIMSQGRTGTSDILTIAAIRSSTTDAAVKAVLQWKEIR